MNFSIIVPLFNEELNISNLVDEIIFNLKSLGYNYEIILVNDASTDNTNEILNDLINKYKEKIKVIINSTNLGQSFSLFEGIKNSQYDTIVTIDGDGQNNPKDIPILLKKYFSEKNISLVGGIRKKRKDSYVKMISSKIANKVREYIKSKGLKTHTDVILGLPGETRESFINGIQQVIDAGVSTVGIYTLMLLHGTPFQDPEYQKKYGIRGIPTIMLFNDGKLIDTKVGSLPKSALILYSDPISTSGLLVNVQSFNGVIS